MDEKEFTMTDETSIKERWKRYVEELQASEHKSSSTYRDDESKED